MRFTWSDEEQDYEIAFADEGEDEDALLEGLFEDMDLRAFLPEDEVSEGDSWDIDPIEFRLANSPGGVDFVGDDEDQAEEELEDDLDEAMDGDFTGTLRGTREEGGRRVAVIGLELELETSAEQTVDREEGEVLLEVAATFELEGELLWDLEGGHLAGLELDGTLEMREAETSIFVAPNDVEYEVVQTMEMSGDYRIAVQVERR